MTHWTPAHTDKQWRRERPLNGALPVADWAEVLNSSYRNSIADAFSRWFLVLSVAALFLISPMVLFQWGFSYEEVGGNPLEKIHPGSFIAILALLFRLAARGPIRHGLKVLLNNGGLLSLVATTSLLLWYAIFIQKIPFSPIIDTFGLPILLFILLVGTPRVTRGHCGTLLHLIFAANALLALYEYVSGNRLTPYVAGTMAVDDDWRATALLGHPLNNAVLTGAYILILSARGGAGLGRASRSIQIIIQLAAMIAFGARASLVVMLLLLGFIMLKNMTLILSGQMHVTLRFLAIIALFLPIAGGVLFGLDDIGFFDRLIERFVEDKGSASARIAMFQLFNYVPLRDILFGPNPELLDTLKRIEGVEAGIESFWVAFILTYGLVMSLIFFIGLFAFCVNVVVRTRSFTAVVFVFFFVVASTSVSLSAKSPGLGMLVVMVFVMLRPEQLRPKGQPC